MSFNTIEELRKSRGNFDTLLNQVEKMSTTTTESNDDGREWKPTVDQAGNGYAVIRFCPQQKVKTNIVQDSGHMDSKALLGSGISKTLSQL